MFRPRVLGLGTESAAFAGQGWMLPGTTRDARIVSSDCAGAVIISSNFAGLLYIVRGIFVTYMMYVEWVASSPTQNQ
jgi:hypothetical protein